MATAIYPGSFDPITLGHVDIVTRASRLFGKIVMAIVSNPAKKTLFTLEERVKMVRESLSHLDNIEIVSFEGLTVDLARSHKAQVIIRGLRAVSDFEYEFAMSQMNRRMAPDVETLFMMAGIEYQFLSSSMAKEVALLGGDVQGLVPEQVHSTLKKKRAVAGGAP